MRIFLASFKNDLRNSFKLGANAEHPLNTALFFSHRKEGKKIDNLIHQFDIRPCPNILWVLQNIGKKRYKR